ncbi:MAG: tetratricopeptide repeat protein [Limnospira sp. PMC 1293.21]|uniref:tetratricopeptide repeat protein n=1 Tax=Limnospira sp. PMC 1293.21 TaxID=2981076 RepID=UPI0028E10A04|nr:tetratricopeptide repeat protein [Limnospira sp. PMC 1293.21]MDT9281854.1 tetratricopeptide repeat protein [Limnospira sp. PMC 1293.21]
MTDFYGFGTISHGFGMALVWGVSQLVSDLVRGNQLLRSGKLEEAVDAFQKAIALQHFIPISQDFSNPARVVVGRL